MVGFCGGVFCGCVLCGGVLWGGVVVVVWLQFWDDIFVCLLWYSGVSVMKVVFALGEWRLVVMVFCGAWCLWHYSWDDDNFL